MLGTVKRSLIFNEFSEKEQEYYFSIKEKAVSHHIDTLYYSVFIQDDDVNVKDTRILGFLEQLNILKEQKISDILFDTIDKTAKKAFELGKK